MPLYEYQCLENGHTFEVRHPITQDPVNACPLCGSPVRRVIFPVGIVFKGSGFYATDSRGKGPSAKAKPADGASEAKTDGGDSKPETKAEQKPSSATSNSGAKPSGESKATSPSASDSST